MMDIALPFMDKLKQGFLAWPCLEHLLSLLLVAQVGDFGKKMKVPFVIAGKEEDKGVDGVAVKGSKR